VRWSISLANHEVDDVDNVVDYQLRQSALGFRLVCDCLVCSGHWCHINGMAVTPFRARGFLVFEYNYISEARVLFLFCVNIFYLSDSIWMF